MNPATGEAHTSNAIVERRHEVSTEAFEIDMAERVASTVHRSH